MEFQFDVKGIEESLNNLELKKRKIILGQNSVLKESAQPLIDEIRNTTPIDVPGHNTEHARDEVTYGRVKTRTGEKSIDVGYTGNVAWRMFFLEYGTYSLGNPKGIVPRHIVERALRNSMRRVAEVQMNGLRALIGGV